MPRPLRRLEHDLATQITQRAVNPDRAGLTRTPEAHLTPVEGVDPGRGGTDRLSASSGA